MEQGTTGAPRLLADENQKESHADRFWAAALAAGVAATAPRSYGYRPARPNAPVARVPGRLQLQRKPVGGRNKLPDKLKAFAGRARFGRGLP